MYKYIFVSFLHKLKGISAGRLQTHEWSKCKLSKSQLTKSVHNVLRKTISSFVRQPQVSNLFTFSFKNI